MSLSHLLSTHSRILTECAIAERLRRMPDISLHPTLFNTPLIYGPDEARDAMVSIYHEYIDIASGAGLPLLLTAPTWRLDHTRTRDAGVPSSINTDAVSFLTQVVADRELDHPVLVGALVGPQNDCYSPELAPSTDDAAEFHRPQIEELAATPAAFLQSQTLPSIPEALGIARTMAAVGKPYIISFCTGPDGRVLDGTPLPLAFAIIDKGVATPPAGYYVNCTHPSFISSAYQASELERLIGIQANASSKDVTELDGATATVADPLDDWAEAMLHLHRACRVTVLGGCCGTSSAHLRALTE